MSQTLSGFSLAALSVQGCATAHSASVAQSLNEQTGRSVQLLARASLRSVKALAVVQHPPALYHSSCKVNSSQTALEAKPAANAVAAQVAAVTFSASVHARPTFALAQKAAQEQPTSGGCRIEG